MATILANRAKETTATTGTGTYDLDGTTAGFQKLVDAAEAQEAGGGPWEVYYLVTDGTDWELGIGTLTDAVPDTLTRDTILESSNGGSAVNWGSGTRNVLITAAAVDGVLPSDSGLRKLTVHTSNGTHNFDADAQYAYIEVIGGGGAGGASTSVNGVPGGGGGYGAKLISVSGISSATITVGSGGNGSAGAGGSGGNSSYADGTNSITANGGSGGSSGASGVAAGGGASGGDANYTGAPGTNEHARGFGAGSAYMATGAAARGQDATQPGAGGAGGLVSSGNGGDGFRGEVRIFEYF